MNVLEYFETFVDSLQEYRWVIELANHCYPIAAMAKMHGSAHILNPRRKSKPIPVKSDSTDISLSSSFSGRYSPSTTSTDAIETTESSTDDTLSMISSPWTSYRTKTTDSDSWTDSPSEDFLTFVNRTDTYTSVSIQPKTSTTIGLATPFTSNSRMTVTLMSQYASESNQASKIISPIIKQNELSYNTSSWTMESYTSTGGLDTSSTSSRLKVKYPWSPNTLDFNDLTDCYPDSSSTLSSQKVSRESFSATKEPDKMKPMNYIAISLDENVLFDWILIKQRGLDGQKLLVPAKV